MSYWQGSQTDDHDEIDQQLMSFQYDIKKNVEVEGMKP